MKSVILIFAVLGFLTLAQAEDAVVSKTKETANDVKRASKKGAHRVEEAACIDSDVKCLEKKSKNRVKEGSEYMGDKIDESKDKK